MPLEVRELTHEEWPLWEKLVAISPQRSIFVERWWMDTITQGGVRILGCFQGKRLVAGLPIWPCRRLGVSYLRHPPFTRWWGPVLLPPNGKYSTQLSLEINILYAFAEALDASWPETTLSFHPSLTNWLAFYWHCFSQTISYTYRIPNWDSFITENSSWQNLLHQSLHRYRREGLRVCEDMDPLQISDLPHVTPSTPAMGYSSDERQIWAALVQELQTHHCVHTVGVVNREGSIQTLSAMVWDQWSAYCLFSGADTARRYSESLALRISYECDLARTLAPAYYFEASTEASHGDLFRLFGGQLTPQHQMTCHRSLRLNLLRHIEQQCHRNRYLQPAIELPVTIDTTISVHVSDLVSV